MAIPLLEVENLRVQFCTIDGLVTAVNGVDLAPCPGKTVGLVGESGSGKRVTAMGIMRLLAEEPPLREIDAICFARCHLIAP